MPLDTSACVSQSPRHPRTPPHHSDQDQETPVKRKPGCSPHPNWNSTSCPHVVPAVLLLGLRPNPGMAGALVILSFSAHTLRIWPLIHQALVKGHPVTPPNKGPEPFLSTLLPGFTVISWPHILLLSLPFDSRGCSLGTGRADIPGALLGPRGPWDASPQSAICETGMMTAPISLGFLGNRPMGPL